MDQLCWGMKKFASQLKGKVVEVAVDATCEYFDPEGSEDIC